MTSRKLPLLSDAVALAFFSLSCSRISPSKADDSKDSNDYQAVFLDSGAVFFGHLRGLGTPYPVMTDAFYVQTLTAPETKQTRNILVKRGKEWHAPDKMTLNAAHIIFVESVTAGSTVANLIAQAK
jgi:hypothetical protein